MARYRIGEYALSYAVSTSPKLSELCILASQLCHYCRGYTQGDLEAEIRIHEDAPPI